MNIDPAATEVVNVYKLLIGSIVPRPIAFVSTVSADGVLNLSPFSFFTAVSARPPVIGFSPMIGLDGRRKDTRNNAEATGEFVVNVVSESFGERMVQTSADVPPETDEFELGGFTPAPSERVGVPRVAESRVAMECRLVQIVDVGSGPMSGSFVMGEVLCFHVDDAIIENFRIDADALAAIGRMAGNSYTRTADRFDMARPGG